MTKNIQKLSQHLNTGNTNVLDTKSNEAGLASDIEYVSALREFLQAILVFGKRKSKLLLFWPFRQKLHNEVSHSDH